MAKHRRNRGDVDLRNVTKICMLVTLVLAFNLSGAMGQFGSKVVTGDMDEGHFLENFALGQTPVSVGFWDIGPNPGLFDEGDVAYLHFGPVPPTPIAVNDIRLTPFAIYMAGSKVVPTNNDVGQILVPFPPPTRIAFVDVGGAIGSYDPMDTVYIDIAPPIGSAPVGTTSIGDIRLTPADVFPAGSLVRNFDMDNNLPLILLTPFPVLGPTPSPKIRFYNENGNVNVGAVSIYDSPDDVYLDISVIGLSPFGFVTPNAVRPSN